MIKAEAKSFLESFFLDYHIYIYIHGILSSSPWRWERVYFSGPVGGLPYHMDSRGTPSYGKYGGVRISDFPGGNAVPISSPIGKCRTKSIKVNLTNFHREICRIKFYLIVTSDVRYFHKLGHVFIHWGQIGAPKEATCFLQC